MTLGAFSTTSSMRRLQFIEIHDRNWFPEFLRDEVTNFLQWLLNLAHAYQSIVPRLREALESAGSGQVLDLCSGAGGQPWRAPVTFLIGYPTPATRPVGFNADAGAATPRRAKDEPLNQS
jgi:hypothetical protein